MMYVAAVAEMFQISGNGCEWLWIYRIDPIGQSVVGDNCKIAKTDVKLELEKNHIFPVIVERTRCHTQTRQKEVTKI